MLREARDPDYHQVVLTTNYDDVMERAFRAASEPFDVVWYVADGPEQGKFVHRLHSGDVRLIEDRNTYRGIEIDRRSLVVKVHGTVDRFGPQRDSYVITIDDYLDYLVRADVAAFLPPEIVNKLYSSHFLFLGYGLKDWNLQVILRRIWGGQRLATRASWAVWNPDPIEKLLWEKRGVEVIDARLEEYIAGLEERFLKAVA